MALYAEIGDTRGVANTLTSLGLVCYSSGDAEAAWELLTRSLELNRALGNKDSVAWTLNNLGTVAVYSRSDYASARPLYEESLSLFHEINDQRGIGNTLHSLGDLFLKEGDTARARKLMAESLHVYREIGDMRGVTYGLETMAAVYVHQGNAHRAAALWSAANALRKSRGTPLPPTEQEKQQEAIAQGRVMLGDDAWTQAWAEGGTLQWEQAIQYALCDTDEATKEPVRVYRFC